MSPFKHQSSKLKKLYTSIFLLALLGVIVSSFLIYVHFEPSATGSFCKIDDYWNCDKVNKSTFAAIFGIPVSFYGFAFYAFLSVVSFGLIRGWNWLKAISPFKPCWLPTVAFIGCSAITTALLFYEPPLLGNLAAWGIVKNLGFIALYLSILLFCRKHSYQTVQFLGFLAILALFGVNFSLYLTDIELFVLEAICIFCFIQQIIILIISALSILALKQNKNDHSNQEHGKLGG